MFDLHHDPTSIALINAFAAAKKPLSAVCHGPTVFLKASDTAGESLLKSVTKITGFSNVEEAQTGRPVPYLLEDELDRVTGGGYVKSETPWGENVVVSKVSTGSPLITGQNPASASGVGMELLKALGL